MENFKEQLDKQFKEQIKKHFKVHYQDYFKEPLTLILRGPDSQGGRDGCFKEINEGVVSDPRLLYRSWTYIRIELTYKKFG